MGKLKLMLLGPPGAGKGTQAKKICSRYGIVHISTGDILRAEIKAGSDLGKMAQSFLDAGELVPDEVIMGIIRKRVEAEDCQRGFLFDGFPRTIGQAEALAAFAQLGAVFSLEVPIDVLVRRLSGRRVCRACAATYHVDVIGNSTICESCGGEVYQRNDDSEATVQNRLAVYVAQTSPLIQHYQAQGILHEIDGNRPVDVVFADIERVLEKSQ